jgi:hypoxanthine phosphoribosyltransferase
VLEDIVETGNTLAFLNDFLRDKNPISFEIATLLFKPECYHHNFDVKYVGLKITNDFVVGYGLDYDNLGRSLPEIYRLKNS